ncbi:MAG TPA: membrane-bound lytic murein transglycosylase MltF [Alteromonas australica]|uniref:Membrane-bound lytic murein transglycosylase F n=1 Tax=Alteromonas australica TaxID=589873 RepID=A0A075P464_9ALTE|nr:MULTISPECIES: membrane-bound lytic murein transglycosylase MltF [Alteromonas]MAB91870.1 membrane-bound lytic murein transglycosylase MltF [Alteromonas sp.]AIF98087.1 lytic murein transglycosylase [Alteromonas australica]AJP43144.1 lytic murein transglycosylase [Alteromonas australica]MAF71333.1 membrane-bound lytic murein transglycosylase MltF [Alteromonas sp.]MBU32506.1 membrane-bound lytic murein transglycosylase MltF [Alteromonas sp.]
MLSQDLKNRLKITFFIALCLFATSCGAPKIPNALSSLLERGSVKVGTLYGPATYYNGAEGPQGFEYELLAGFADYLGVTLDLYPFYSYEAMLEQLEEGNLDIVATGDAVTDVLQSRFSYGPAYQTVSQHLVFQAGTSRPRDMAELDAPVVTVTGSSQAQLLTSLSDDAAPTLITTEDSDSEELLQKVAEGELDYTLADSNRLALQRRRYPNLAVAMTIEDSMPMAWALDRSQDDSIKAAMVEYFGTVHQSGWFTVLEDKYFGHIRTFDYVDSRAFNKSAETTLKRYKSMFQQYAGDLDWRLLAAMSYQESHWKPDAVSRTGVRGLMMLTMDTANDWDVEDRTDPEQSIRGGARYFASLLSRIPARIGNPDRTWMAMAAYNIGMGHLEDARVLTERQGGNPDLWVDVKQRLPQLKQKKYYRTTNYGYARGDEALQYVDNIRRYYDSLVWLDEQGKI